MGDAIQTMAVLVIWMSGVVLVSAIYILLRNNWVFEQRRRLIYKDWSAYQRLPSYGAMLWRFWVWDVRKFYPMEEQADG